MRPTLIGLAVVLGLGAFANTSKAQDGGFSDPFFLYYGWYLPRQNALATQRQPEDQIRAMTAQRGYEVRTERQGLYEPIPTLGLDELDPLRPFGQRSGSTRLVRTSPRGIVSENLSGHGPGRYYSHVGSYYPTIRSGRARSGAAPAARFGGGRGMGGMPGLPGAPGVAR